MHFLPSVTLKHSKCDTAVLTPPIFNVYLLPYPTPTPQLDDDEESDEAKSSTNHPSADALASISVFACDDEDVPEASPLRRHEFAARTNGMRMHLCARDCV